MNKLVTHMILPALLMCVIASGCAPQQATGPTEHPAPLEQTITHNRVRLLIRAEPPRVELERDTLLTIETGAPLDYSVVLPALEDRLTGFVISGAYDDEPVTTEKERILKRHFRLTPVVAQEYRLAPFAVLYSSGANDATEPHWFPSPPVRFEVVPPSTNNIGSDIKSDLSPVWIYPPFKTIALYIIIFILALALLYCAWRLLKRIKHTIKVMRMSPRERALHELNALLARDLPAHHKVKEFYLELTMIVRRYIERAHGIRAPEQTTEEFLAAVQNDKRFLTGVTDRLKSFLEAADLVKFAAFKPGSDAIAQATGTARRYIETDSETNPGEAM